MEVQAIFNPIISPYTGDLNSSLQKNHTFLKLQILLSFTEQKREYQFDSGDFSLINVNITDIISIFPNGTINIVKDDKTSEFVLFRVILQDDVDVFMKNKFGFEFTHINTLELNTLSSEQNQSDFNISRTRWPCTWENN